MPGTDAEGDARARDGRGIVPGVPAVPGGPFQVPLWSILYPPARRGTLAGQVWGARPSQKGPGKGRPGLADPAYGPPAMPGPAPARTPAKQSPAAPAAIPRTAAPMQAGKDTPPMPERRNSQEEHAGNSPGIMEVPRIISYNLREGERPGGMKVRFKIRVETGKKAAALNAQQAEAIKELLLWVRQHRHQSR
jgi:hypothetical protein